MIPPPDKWEDMSRFVVHFTKRRTNTEKKQTFIGIELDADYSAITSILGSGVITAQNAFGIGLKTAPDKESQKTVCFSEVPPGHWQRLVERRKTQYGLAFEKDFIVKRGGGPIWYAYKDTPQLNALRKMMSAAARTPAAEIWAITPFIDAPGDYPVTRTKTAPRYFEWEREWRLIGDLRFAPTEVAFLLLPERLHPNARTFFEKAQADNMGPAYYCPFVDPTWERQKILDTIHDRRHKDSL